MTGTASFLGSAFFLVRIHPEEPPAAEPGNGALTAGAKFIGRSVIMRTSLVAASIVNFYNFVFFALFVLYATRYLHIEPGPPGLVLGIGAIGGVLGAAVTKRLAGRFGVGRVYTISFLVFAAPMALVPAAAGPRPLILAMLMAAEFIGGFGVMVLDITIGSIFSAVIPADLRSRVTDAFQAVTRGTRPLGALLGGFLGTLIGPRATLWVAAIGGMTAFLVLLPTSVPRFRMPAGAPRDDRRAATAAHGSEDLAGNPARGGADRAPELRGHWPVPRDEGRWPLPGAEGRAVEVSQPPRPCQGRVPPGRAARRNRPGAGYGPVSRGTG